MTRESSSLDPGDDDPDEARPGGRRPRSSEVPVRGDQRIRPNVRDRSRLEQIAGIGRWRWNAAEDEATWSPGLYQLLEPGAEDRGAESYESYLDRVHPEDRENVHEVLQDAIKSRSPRGVEHRVRDPEDGDRWLQCHVRPERGSQDTLELAVTCVDVTRRRRTEHELASEPTTDEEHLALATSRLLRERAGWILHPLATLEEPNEDAVAEVQQARRGARRMLDDVETLLEDRPPARGRDPQAPVGIEGLLDRAVHRARARLGEGDPSVTFDVDPAVPSRLRVDEKALQSGLEAMIRHTMRRGQAVQVSVQLASEHASSAPGEDVVLLIDAERWGRPRRRTRGSLAEARPPEGEGIHDASAEATVLRRCADRLDADVEGLDSPDGARLRLTVPARRAGKHQRAAPRDQQRLHALVVGPAEPGRRRVVDALERLGTRARSAPARSDVEELVQGTGTDVVLVDLDGAEAPFGLVRGLRETLPAVQQPFVVGLAEAPEPVPPREVEEAGVDEILAKPVGRDRLEPVLAGLVRPRLR